MVQSRKLSRRPVISCVLLFAAAAAFCFAIGGCSLIQMIGGTPAPTQPSPTPTPTTPEEPAEVRFAPILRYWEADRVVTTIDGLPVELILYAKDQEREALSFRWNYDGGSLELLGDTDQGLGQYASSVRWTPLNLEVGRYYTVRCIVSDADGDWTNWEIPIHVTRARHVLIGQPPAPGDPTFEPAVLDFGSDAVELSTALRIAAEHPGDAAYLPWSLASKPDWITSISPDSGSGSATLTLTADRAGLVDGFHSGNVVLEFVEGERTQWLILQVVCLVGQAAGSSIVSVFPGVLDFGSEETSKTFNVQNAGAGILEWAVVRVGDAPWIADITPPSGTGDGGVNVLVDRTGLSAGNYTGTLIIESSESTAEVAVLMTVASEVQIQPELAVSVNALQFTHDDMEKTFEIQNIGGGVLEWTAASDQSWLSLSPWTGSGPATVTATADSAGLRDGVYRGILSIESNGGNADISVVLQVPEADVGVIVRQSDTGGEGG